MDGGHALPIRIDSAMAQSGDPLMGLDPALVAALRASTLQAVRAKGAFDALVIGAGAAGGLAALLLAEAGLRVLVLDAGLPRSPIRSLSRRLARGTIRRLL